MKERKAITRELSERYKKATKKQKGIILDEFTIGHMLPNSSSVFFKISIWIACLPMIF